VEVVFVCSVKELIFFFMYTTDQRIFMVEIYI
jgi:hypothetical protein